MTEFIERLEELDQPFVKVAITDIDGILRGKYMAREKVVEAAKRGFGFCNVVFGWDSNDQVYDNATLSGWHTGYADGLARLDPTTLREIPWEDGTPFCLADFAHDQSGLADACPRTLLKRVVAKAESMGFTPKFGPEFEWFTLRETPDSLVEKGYHRPLPISPSMFGYSILRTTLNAPFFRDLLHQLRAFRIPLEGLHTETGPGVLEAAIRYDDVLSAADRAVLFKTAVKEIAYRHGFLATFMAKWREDLPGCSGHLHQSLWRDGENQFGSAEHPRGMSKLMEHYVAGQLHCLPELMPLLAPTINSYKRYVAGSWAATGMNWGIGNRTTALRVIAADPGSTRLETRLPGADANPYLSIAAALAAGLYGIERELPLTTEAIQGNAYADQDQPSLPRTLAEAVGRMKASELPGQLLGDAFCRHFIATREWEVRQHEVAVTDWELRRYLEII
ncbi:glutamine synthetase family protein [Lewinella sp. W8]|uniref:glutamine synthetase family protein n=1 Tax=Lewinella sp. W8 TaxID=2528208 RepID=UPI0010680795|nr:glutamine synthetase [Lewinella sp. W8]MTB50955.1 glutamine synthetase [Lewinella sp. W8]